MRSCAIRFDGHFPLTVRLFYLLWTCQPGARPLRGWKPLPGVWIFGKVFQADTGGTAVVRVLRPVGPQAEPKSLG
jgi:hypothetical protein